LIQHQLSLRADLEYMRKRKHYVTKKPFNGSHLTNEAYGTSMSSIQLQVGVAKIENHSELMSILRASVIEADSDEQSNQDTNSPELEKGLIRHRLPSTTAHQVHCM